MQFGPIHMVAGSLAVAAPVCATAQSPDIRDFRKTVWEIALYGGFNATQVRLVSDTANYFSNGYNSFATGGGVAVLMNPAVAFELDAIYTGRVFGFGASKGFFNCLQFPLNAHLRLGPIKLGAGVYGAAWSEMGKIVRGSSSAEVNVNDLGNESREFGFFGLIGYSTRIQSVPVRFEFRSFSSETDIASSKSLKGSISEYQLLVGYDFDMSSPRPFWGPQGSL